MTTTDEIMLIKVSAQDNNNKFYHLTLDGDLVHKRWGRVGATGQSKTDTGGRMTFDRTVRDKTRHGYEPVEVISSSVEQKPTANLRAAAASLVSETDKGSAALEALIDRLVAVNRHEILESSGGKITINTNGVVSTPLGIISLAYIDKAQRVLEEVKACHTTSLVERYMTLVPQKVKRDWATTMLKSATDIKEQEDLLTQLRASVTWAEAEKTATVAAKADDDIATKYKNLFKYTISEVTDPKIIADVTKRYTTSKNGVHASSRLKVKRVFALTDPAGEKEFQKVVKAEGNVQQLWHGTRAFNVLSVLRKGLFVPPVSGTQIPIAGRMFGDGVYFSNQSTKALNYSHGYWTAGGREDNCFMFLADVALGWEYQPNRHGVNRVTSAELRTAHTGTDTNGRKYGSISVRGGTCGVQNNEIIVWNTKAIAIRYLVEFSA